MSHLHIHIHSFSGDSVGKESTCNTGDLGSMPGLGKSPGGGHGNPLQHSCLENPHEQRRLAGCSPWGCTELNTTKQVSIAQTYTHNIILLCHKKKKDEILPFEKTWMDLEHNMLSEKSQKEKKILNILFH